MKGARRTRKPSRSEGGFADLMKPPHPTSSIRGVITGVARNTQPSEQQPQHQQTTTSTVTHFSSQSARRSSGSVSTSTKSPLSPSSPFASNEEDWGTILNTSSHTSPRIRRNSTTISPASQSRSVSSLNPSPRRSLPLTITPKKDETSRPLSFQPVVNTSSTDIMNKSNTDAVPAFLSGWEGAQGWADDPCLDDSDPDLENNDEEDAWGAWDISEDLTTSIPQKDQPEKVQESSITLEQSTSTISKVGEGQEAQNVSVLHSSEKHIVTSTIHSSVTMSVTTAEHYDNGSESQKPQAPIQQKLTLAPSLQQIHSVASESTQNDGKPSLNEPIMDTSAEQPADSNQRNQVSVDEKIDQTDDHNDFAAWDAAAENDDNQWPDMDSVTTVKNQTDNAAKVGTVSQTIEASVQLASEASNEETMTYAEDTLKDESFAEQSIEAAKNNSPVENIASETNVDFTVNVIEGTPVTTSKSAHETSCSNEQEAVAVVDVARQDLQGGEQQQLISQSSILEDELATRNTPQENLHTELEDEEGAKFNPDMPETAPTIEQAPHLDVWGGFGEDQATNASPENLPTTGPWPQETSESKEEESQIDKPELNATHVIETQGEAAASQTTAAATAQQISLTSDTYSHEQSRTSIPPATKSEFDVWGKFGQDDETSWSEAPGESAWPESATMESKTESKPVENRAELMSVSEQPQSAAQNELTAFDDGSQWANTNDDVWTAAPRNAATEFRDVTEAVTFKEESSFEVAEDSSKVTSEIVVQEPVPQAAVETLIGDSFSISVNNEQDETDFSAPAQAQSQSPKPVQEPTQELHTAANIQESSNFNAHGEQEGVEIAFESDAPQHEEADTFAAIAGNESVVHGMPSEKSFTDDRASNLEASVQKSHQSPIDQELDKYQPETNVIEPRDQTAKEEFAVGVDYSGWPTEETNSTSINPYAPKQPTSTNDPPPDHTSNPTNFALDQTEGLDQYAPQSINVTDNNQPAASSSPLWPDPAHSAAEETNQVVPPLADSLQENTSSAGWAWGESMETGPSDQNAFNVNVNTSQWTAQDSFVNDQNTTGTGNESNQQSTIAANDWGWGTPETNSLSRPADTTSRPTTVVPQTNQTTSSHFTDAWGFEANEGDVDNTAWGWTEETQTDMNKEGENERQSTVQSLSQFQVPNQNNQSTSLPLPPPPQPIFAPQDTSDVNQETFAKRTSDIRPQTIMNPSLGSMPITDENTVSEATDTQPPTDTFEVEPENDQNAPVEEKSFPEMQQEVNNDEAAAADAKSTDVDISSTVAGTDVPSVAAPSSVDDNEWDPEGNSSKWELPRPSSSLSVDTSRAGREDAAISDIKSTEVDISSTVAGTDVPSVAAVSSIDDNEWDSEHQNGNWDLSQAGAYPITSVPNGPQNTSSIPSQQGDMFIDNTQTQSFLNDSLNANNVTTSDVSASFAISSEPSNLQPETRSAQTQDEFDVGTEQNGDSNINAQMPTNISYPEPAGSAFYQPSQQSSYPTWDAPGFSQESITDSRQGVATAYNPYQPRSIPNGDDELEAETSTFQQEVSESVSTNVWDTDAQQQPDSTDVPDYQSYAPRSNEQVSPITLTQPAMPPPPAQNLYWAQRSASIANNTSEQHMNPEPSDSNTINWSEKDHSNNPSSSNYDSCAPSAIPPPPTFLPTQTQGVETAPMEDEPANNISNNVQMQPEFPYQDTAIGYDVQRPSGNINDELGYQQAASAYPEPPQPDPYNISYAAPDPIVAQPKQDHTAMVDPSIYSYSFSIMDTAPSGGMDYRPPHAIISWGFGGTLLTVVPTSSCSSTDAIDDSQATQSNRSSSVNIYDVSSLGVNFANEEWTAAMEAVTPLLYPVSPPDLLPYAEMCDRLSNSATSGSLSESRSALWRILATICRNCTSDWRGAASTAISGPASVPLMGSSSNIPSQAVVESPLRALSATSDSSYHDQSNAAIEVERLITGGQNYEALQVARHAQLWSLAILTASTLDKQTYMETVTEFAKANLKDGSGLQTLCFAMAENDEEIVRKATSVSGLNEWRKTLSTVLASRKAPTDPSSRHSTRHLRIIEKVGDALMAQGGDIVAAHICYLLCGSIESLSRSSITLLGADDNKPAGRPRSLGSPEAVLQSLVFEAITNAQTGSSFPHLLPFRYLLAAEIAIVGRVDIALAHCEAISSSVREIFESGRNDIASETFTPPFLAALDHFELRLRGCLGLQEPLQKKGPLSTLGKSLSSVFSRTLQGTKDEKPSPKITPQLSASNHSQSGVSELPPMEVPGPYPSQVSTFDSSQPLQSAWEQPNPVQIPAQQGAWGVPENVNMTAMSSASQQYMNPNPTNNINEEAGNKRWNSFVANTIGVLAPADGDLSPPPRAHNDTNLPGNIHVAPPLGLGPGKGTRTPGHDLTIGHMRSASVGDVPMSEMPAGSLDVGNVHQFTTPMNHSTTTIPSQYNQSSEFSNMMQFNGVPVQRVASKPADEHASIRKRSSSDVTLQSQTSEKKPPRPPRRATGQTATVDNVNEKPNEKAKGWKARLTERIRSAMNFPKQAHMGVENKFIFNKELGRWVIEGEDPNDEDDVPPPPPDDEQISSSHPGEEQSSSTFNSYGGQEASPSSMPRSYSVQDSMAPAFGNVRPHIPRASSFTPSYPESAPADRLSFQGNGSESSAASGATGPISVASQPISPGPRTASSNKYRAGAGRLSGRRAYVDTFNRGRPTPNVPVPFPGRSAAPLAPGGGLAGGRQGYKIFTPVPTPTASSDTDSAVGPDIVGVSDQRMQNTSTPGFPPSPGKFVSTSYSGSRGPTPQHTSPRQSPRPKMMA